MCVVRLYQFINLSSRNFVGAAVDVDVYMVVGEKEIEAAALTSSPTTELRPMTSAFSGLPAGAIAIRESCY